MSDLTIPLKVVDNGDGTYSLRRFILLYQQAVTNPKGYRGHTHKLSLSRGLTNYGAHLEREDNN